MLITLVGVTAACAWDIRTGRIPNLLTLPFSLLGLLVNAVQLGIPGVKDSLFGMLTGAGLLLIPFALGGMGAGDVKMLAMVGALNGPRFVFRAFLFGAIAGGIFAIVMMLWTKRRRALLANNLIALAGYGNHILAVKRRPITKGSMGSLVMSGVRFPYGVAIFAGTIAAYLVRW